MSFIVEIIQIKILKNCFSVWQSIGKVGPDPGFRLCPLLQHRHRLSKFSHIDVLQSGELGCGMRRIHLLHLFFTVQHT